MTQPLPVQSTDYKKIWNFVHQTWGSIGKDGKGTPFFPGPQPISIERRHMVQLRAKPYMVCEKTDGVRMALVCLDGLCVLVNRSMVMTPVKLRVPQSAYKGTILDGEFTTTKSGKDHYMVYDTLMVNGASVKTEDLVTRLNTAEEMVKKILKTVRDPFLVKMKTFNLMKRVGSVIEKVTNSDYDYNTDGLIFTPINEPVRMGTHETLFKWKPLDHNTIDFLVKNRPDGCMGLYIQDRGELIFSGMIKPDQVSKEWHDALTDNCIAECQYQTNAWPKWWRPQNIRTDKTHPNNRRTLNRTVVNIEEDIRIEEFV